ncbi:MAG: AAA family ATPase, partial [Pseudomonadota bacterium]
KRHAEGRQVVIFVEEAQGMPLATLEEIRLLSNLETRQDKLLQIVLFGQPELDVNLNETHIRQLRERITHSFNLGPLQTKDIGEYLIFRLRAAGYHGPHLFTNAAIKRLSSAAEGLVRRVNILADKALLAAFAENAFQVTPKHVKAAVQDSEFGAKSTNHKKYLQLVLIVAGLLSISLVYVLWKSPSNVSNKTIVNSVVSSSAKASPKISSAVAVKVEPEKAIAMPINSVNGLSALAAKANSTIVVPVVSQPAVATITNIQKDVPKKEAAVVAAVAPPVKPVVEGVVQNAEKKTAKVAVVKAIEAKSLTLESRLEATRHLLLSRSPDTLTLQIKSLRYGEQFTDEQLRTEFDMTRRQLGAENLYLYRKKQNGEDYTVILYGAFAQRSEALAALKKLPSQIKDNKPYLRTVAEVNKEIE